MRVALVSRAAHPLHPTGGLERAVYHLAVHLESRGVRTILVTRPPTRDGTFPGEVVTVPYRFLPAGGHGRVLDRTLNYPRFALRAGEAVAAMVRAGRVDLVHAQGLGALGYARLRRKEPGLRAPLIMNPQGMEEHKARGLKGLALGRLKRLSREAARLADRVIATDEATRGELRALLQVEDERIVVLPNGIDPVEIARVTPTDPEFAQKVLPALKEASPLFLSVGRLEAYKGFADVLSALIRLKDSLPRTWAWVAVGEGPEGRRLARAAAAAGIERHVHLPGRASDILLHALYARADVFVHATHLEGSSLVTLEAMAHSLPVVATRAGGIPDKVVEGQTGSLVAPGDIPALSRCLAQLADRPDLRKAMGERGLSRVLAHFSWTRLAEKTIELYEHLLKAQR